MTQVGYLGSQAAKYLLLALKFTLGKVFNTKNITVPLNFVLGGDLSKNHKELEAAWKNSGPKDVNFFLKAYNGIKKLALIALGIAVGLVLMLFKRNKDHQLKMKEQQEKIEAQKRKEEMEAMWAK